MDLLSNGCGFPDAGVGLALDQANILVQLYACSAEQEGLSALFLHRENEVLVTQILLPAAP